MSLLELVGHVMKHELYVEMGRDIIATIVL